MTATFGALRALFPPASFAGKTVYATELEIARVFRGRDHSGPLRSDSCLARNWLRHPSCVTGTFVTLLGMPFVRTFGARISIFNFG